MLERPAGSGACLSGTQSTKSAVNCLSDREPWDFYKCILRQLVWTAILRNDGEDIWASVMHCAASNHVRMEPRQRNVALAHLLQQRLRQLLPGTGEGLRESLHRERASQQSRTWRQSDVSKLTRMQKRLLPACEQRHLLCQRELRVCPPHGHPPSDCGGVCLQDNPAAIAKVYHPKRILQQALHEVCCSQKEIVLLASPFVNCLVHGQQHQVKVLQHCLLLHSAPAFMPPQSNSGQWPVSWCASVISRSTSVGRCSACSVA